MSETITEKRQKSKQYSPRSHRSGLTVSMSPKRGLHVYFRKHPGRFANCVGDQVRKQAKGQTGLDREAVRDLFTKAAKKGGPCSKK